MWKATLNVAPAGKGRPRHYNGRTITPQKTRFKEAEIKYWLHQMDAPHFGDTPLGVNLYFYFKKPKSAKREYPTVKPDVDNIVKLVLDSANGVLYDDDKQIVDCNVKKRYGDERIEIEIWSMNEKN